MSTPTRMEKATKEDLRAEIAELREVGQLMSNICFNWGQSGAGFHTLTQDDKDYIDGLRIKWDAIKRREPR